MNETRLTPEQMELADACTNLQRKTVLGIIAGKTQRQAYREAGGKAKSDDVADAIVARMLGTARVKAFYESLFAVKANDAIMTREEALERLTRTARVSITDIAEFCEEVVGEDDNGDPVYRTNWRIKDSHEITPEAAAAIKSVTATKFGPKLEMHDPHNAIKQLSDMLGWNAPNKHELTGKDGQPMQLQADINAPEIAAAINDVMQRL